MIHPYSETADEIDYAMAEFGVFPGFRRQHLAGRAVGAIWDMLPGRWQIKYSRRNTAAAKFWPAVSKPYIVKTAQAVYLLF